MLSFQAPGGRTSGLISVSVLAVAEFFDSFELTDGADPLTVAFAAGRRPQPGEVEERVWVTLVAADNA